MKFSLSLSEKKQTKSNSLFDFSFKSDSKRNNELYQQTQARLGGKSLSTSFQFSKTSLA